MNRNKVREQVMHMFFQMDAQNNYNYEQLNIVDDDAEVMKSKRAVAMFRAIRDNRKDIDGIIAKSAFGWTIERMSKTDLAILRTAVCEMKYIDDVPMAVSINEAVNLAKAYGDERSYAFVNAVLSKVGENIE